jgi:autotransporter-associated beta strand protein
MSNDGSDEGESSRGAPRQCRKLNEGRNSNEGRKPAECRERRECRRAKAVRKGLVARRCCFESLEERRCHATLTWVGDIDRNWFTATAAGTNWSGDRLPADGDTLEFSGSTPGAMVNNSPAGNSYSLRFQAAGYAISGNPITLDNPGVDLIDVAGGNSLSTPLVLAGSEWEITSGTLTLTGTLSGTGGMTKSGSGTVRLDAANSFGGGVVLRAGTLDVRNNAALGTGLLTIVGGTLIAGGGSRSLANPVRVEGDFTLGGSNNLTLNAGGSGGITLVGGPRTIQVANALRTLFLDGAVGGSAGDSGIVKTGAGRLAMNRASGFVGGVELRGGTLSVGDSQSLGAGPLLIYAGALQADSAPRVLSNPVNLYGDLTIQGSQRLTLAGDVSLTHGARTWTIDASAPAVVAGAVVAGELIKAGPGTLQVLGSRHDFRPRVVAGSLEWIGVPGVDVGPLSLRVDPRSLGPLSEPDFQTLKDFLNDPKGKTLAMPDDNGLGRYSISGFHSVRLLLRDGEMSRDVTDFLRSLPTVARILMGQDDAGDVLQGTQWPELILGLGGDDTLRGGGGNDWIFGGDGADSIFGDDGFDRIYGGPDSDWLEGGLHDDSLDGGAGADQLFGGDGYDALLVRGEEAEFDRFHGGLNTDVIINQAAAPVRLDRFDASQASVEGWVGGNQPILGNDGPNTLSFLVTPWYSMTLTGVPFVDGGQGDDTIIGTHGVDDLRGGEGRDRLEGQGGADRLSGGEGDDWLDGGEGTDRIAGDAGADAIATGGGRDTVVFAGDVDSLDTLVDFALYSDQLDLTAYSIAYNSLAFQRLNSPSNVLVRLANGKQIRLLGWNRPVQASQVRT